MFSRGSASAGALKVFAITAATVGVVSLYAGPQQTADLTGNAAETVGTGARITIDMLPRLITAFDETGAITDKAKGEDTLKQKN